MSVPIALVASGLNVAPLVAQLALHPELWNRYTMRTAGYVSPHNAVSDIWVRYNPWRNFHGDPQTFNAEHISEWYPAAADIPAAWSLARKVLRMVGGKRLGGVLITRVPVGGEVKPHIDRGWHAQVHDKYAVQVKGNAKQAFCFEEKRLSAMPGDVYTFDNSKLHWVTNDSAEERITLIICVRRKS